MNRFIAPFFSAAVIVIFLVSTALIPAGNTSGGSLPGNNSGVSQAQALPAVGSFENLKTLLKKVQNSGPRMYEGKFKTAILTDSVASAPEAQMNRAKSEASYSTTNVQVQGVDEADIVKTDGKYIYQVNNRQIVVVDADPADKMKIVSTLNFADENFMPLELYLDKKYLVVIGNFYRIPMPEKPASGKPGPGPEKKIYPPIQHENSVKAIIYDISNPAGIKKLREAELSGSYVASRKIGPAVYLVANKYIDYYWIMEQNMEQPAPGYRDTAGKGEFVSIGYPDIRYFPDPTEPNYLMVAGLNLDLPDKEMEVAAYLGAGQNIYASQNNLYVALTQYPKANTEIYKFALDLGRTEYKNKGAVPGTVLNQFSMDEDQGSFRIATTNGDNNVYILDEAMKITGRLEHIAPGERIYSVRFMDNRAYMVTFKFQGAYVYNLDLSSGFKLKGKITHLDFDDYLKSGQNWYDSDKNIERILYIDDTRYTLSKKILKANDIADLKEKNLLRIVQ